jgi:stearoyl-CoA desaturase (delta-9 desaturase)
LALLIFFIAHWYLSLFTQSFFNHRYAAHKQFSMSRGWEKIWFILTWLFQGSAYLSPYVYGVMHRMHHAYADTEKDPHSPKYDPNLFVMMLRSRDVYNDIDLLRKPIEERFTKNLPRWDGFDKFAQGRLSRFMWVVVYVQIYWLLAPSAIWWVLLPITIIMGPFHGMIINWFAHKYGYTNFETEDTSKNLMPLDIFMLGEGYHNNHHKRASSPNFGWKWYELDPIYAAIRIMNWVGMIQLRPMR